MLCKTEYAEIKNIFILRENYFSWRLRDDQNGAYSVLCWHLLVKCDIAVAFD